MRITIEQIRSFKPCYDPSKHLTEGYDDTIINFLGRLDIPPQDRLWCVVRGQVLGPDVSKRFGLACARLAEKYTQDPRVEACNDAAEGYLNGTVAIAALRTARYATATATAAAAIDAAHAAAAHAADAARTTTAAYAGYAAAAGYHATAAATFAVGHAAAQDMREKQCLALIHILQTTQGGTNEQ